MVCRQWHAALRNTRLIACGTIATAAAAQQQTNVSALWFAAISHFGNAVPEPGNHSG